MLPTLKLQSGGDAPLGKYNNYMGNWGHFGGQPQKGIITFGLAPNRQNPLAGAAHDAVFNVWRRFYSQVFYISIPVIAGYLVIDWASSRNHYLNSKAGRAEFADSEE
ncbi:probable Cytochrome b-c1 complex subunit 8 [Cephalotrichum gorgonifer]|uniref:Cytochrome b-c1 complex subunit 8 n=1 Tax=Cephalotrichum gorgonifer TaxID=2041049 RepID=A0AAE8SRU0_9PEZI|nr:probable Cytochrome b-c1 complex subunit 8 [Cephalotrichum gorgonifer]